MNTLDKIKEYAKKHNMLFRDYRTQSFIGDDPECRYQLIYNDSHYNFKKFNTQEEIREFLIDENNQ